jgi:hypothetical protein
MNFRKNLRKLILIATPRVRPVMLKKSALSSLRAEDDDPWPVQGRRGTWPNPSGLHP